jgi:hypothetical protein
MYLLVYLQVCQQLNLLDFPRVSQVANLQVCRQLSLRDDHRNYLRDDLQEDPQDYHQDDHQDNLRFYLQGSHRDNLRFCPLKFLQVSLLVIPR